MSIDSLEEQLRRDEGEKLYAYQDHLGYWTIGVGILIDKKKGGGITKEESTYLLRNRIESTKKALERALPWLNNLDPIREAVLLNMAFQMGVDGVLGFKNTLAMIKAGKYKEAAIGMLNSKWATQTPERARRMSIQMSTGEWQ